MKTTEILKTILGLVGAASLILACSEAATIMNQVLWSGSMMLICFGCIKGYEALMTDEEKEEKA